MTARTLVPSLPLALARFGRWTVALLRIPNSVNGLEQCNVHLHQETDRKTEDERRSEMVEKM